MSFGIGGFGVLAEQVLLLFRASRDSRASREIRVPGTADGGVVPAPLQHQGRVGFLKRFGCEAQSKELPFAVSASLFFSSFSCGVVGVSETIRF